MSKWIEGKLKDLVEVNPTVKLIKGEIYPFVSMDVIQSSYKPVEAKEEREFKSGGAKFENGDTLFARITPCLEKVLSKVYPPHSRFSLEFQRLEEKKLATPVVFGHH
ncbi:hypothetical protein RA955_03430 [Geobacillus proteiniphilus]|uniref:Uncharacterized protein n=1 Tax=Geobacillus proteiniphilus TaxID=860353 RepID=A0ABY9MGS3_9BACL|nr:hypothetical protein [Geobacillus proteiniphilus]WMJ17185.1 hypothetical protein RA955_03430 [Geobacillus proteiniphilus]